MRIVLGQKNRTQIPSVPNRIGFSWLLKHKVRSVQWLRMLTEGLTVAEIRSKPSEKPRKQICPSFWSKSKGRLGSLKKPEASRHS